MGRGQLKWLAFILLWAIIHTFLKFVSLCLVLSGLNAFSVQCGLSFDS